MLSHGEAIGDFSTRRGRLGKASKTDWAKIVMFGHPLSLVASHDQLRGGSISSEGRHPQTQSPLPARFFPRPIDVKEVTASLRVFPAPPRSRSTTTARR